MQYIITKNKKAYFNYEILDKFEAGIVLTGPEIKSIRAREISINEAFILIRKEEAFLVNSNIKNYEFANNINNLNPTRDRKLLLHKKEIIKILKRIQIEKLTLIPIKLYFINNRAKIEIGLGKGKKNYDKRETIKKRDIERKDLKSYKNNL